MGNWTVYRRNSDLARTGVLEFRRLKMNLRWLRGSPFEIVTHIDEADGVQAGDGLLLVRDGQTVASGLVTFKEREREADDDNVTIVGVDEVQRIGWRVVYPDPTLPADDDLQPAHDVRTDTAEDVILGYVTDNAGPAALNDGSEDRRIPGLVVDASQGRGDTVTGRGRWQPLIGYMATLAERGAVGFRARQQLGTSQITFEVVVPVDRPGVRFDVDGLRGSGELRRFGYAVGMPDVTFAIAGGRGQLDNRLVRQSSRDVDQWGRIEAFLDRNNAGDEGDVPSQEAELDDELDDALREGQGPVDLDLRSVDTDAARWGRDYELGDRVRVKLDDTWLWRQVREVEVTVDADGERTEPKLGDASHRHTLRLLERLGELERRVTDRGRS